ncbi:DUF29 domain-containing protein [uncultured Thiohalocapsa sp.]|uniref:DUF29 domain-containing protein n=1 Tax=uncultured Thiohalocapsa sp. TaxID=768990 RepID=UPI0025EA3453|nr:DUF29 domain-containing protein [uncultured Thiohalocapsa sp.]
MKPEYRIADQPRDPAAQHDADVIAWAHRQAALLRAGRFDELDIEHIADEIEDVARSEQRELASRMAVLLAHLIKWQHQPERRGKSWRLTIRNQRRGIERRLLRTPSLKTSLRDPDWWTDAWDDAVVKALADTGLEELPDACPWSLDQILAPDWLPH